jgi:hypothetical protein
MNCFSVFGFARMDCIATTCFSVTISPLTYVMFMEFAGQTDLAFHAIGGFVTARSTRKVSWGTLRKFTWRSYTHATCVELYSRAKTLSTNTGEHVLVSVKPGVFGQGIPCYLSSMPRTSVGASVTYVAYGSMRLLVSVLCPGGNIFQFKYELSHSELQLVAVCQFWKLLYLPVDGFS